METIGTIDPQLGNPSPWTLHPAGLNTSKPNPQPPNSNKDLFRLVHEG